MGVVVVGGTRFIGRAVVQRLAAAGHEVLCVHRGEHPGDDLPAEHLHSDRADLAGHRADLAAFGPDAAVDVSVGNGADADAALGALPDGIRLVAISSCDVYRAYGSLHAGRQTDALPLIEDSPLRSERFVDGRGFENLEVEERYLPRGATVLRLGAVYGPHDYQRRFEFVLRRVRGGRDRIPFGSGTFLFSRVHVDDVAEAVHVALTTDRAAGEAYNVAESATWPFRVFAERILAAAGSEAELVAVEEAGLPEDLRITTTLSQHLLVSSAKARAELGWRDRDPETAIGPAVRWHLDNPPEDWDDDFSADYAALARPVDR